MKNKSKCSICKKTLQKKDISYTPMCKQCSEDEASDAYIKMLTENVAGKDRYHHLRQSWGESHSVVV